MRPWLPDRDATILTPSIMPLPPLSLVCLASLALAACALPSPSDAAPSRWSECARGDASLRGLAAVDGAIAWASGSKGTILRTTDGGATWRNVAPAGSAAWDFRDVEAFSADRAVAMVAGEPARVLRTDDGGASWRTVLADDRKGAFFDAMAFAGEFGALFGDPIDGAFCVWTTRDGGATWQAVAPSALPAPLPGEAAFAASGSCVAITGAPGREVVWIATGGGAQARLLRGDANGFTAQDLPLPAGAPSRGAFALAFRGDRGIVVGGDYAAPAVGGAAITRDGGRTWSAVDGFGGFRSDIAWLDDDHVLTVGSHGASVGRWDAKPVGAEELGFHACSIGADGHAWAAGSDGRIARRVGWPRQPLRLMRLFSDHMVVPVAATVQVRGHAEPGASVRVTTSWGAIATGDAQADGAFAVAVATPATPGGPHEFAVACGDQRVRVRDVLAGDVWLASGQSNMEMQLGKAGWSQGIDGHEATIAAADLPQLRVFTVKKRASDVACDDVDGAWLVSSPAVAKDFSAVGFHFARAVQQARQRPFGLVVSAWGGTVAEAWTSPDGLQPVSEFHGALAGASGGQGAAEKRRQAFWREVLAADGGAFAPVAMPDQWSRGGLGGFDGAAEYARRIEVPAAWRGRDLVLELGPIDDMDVATWDGERIGGLDRDGSWSTPRSYRIPGRLTQVGEHALAVRVVDTNGEGGFGGGAADLRLRRADDGGEPMPLVDGWQRRQLRALGELPAWPRDVGPNQPAALWRGMIAPLQPFPFAGAIWYQGESNRGRAEQYARLFPALVRDWRAGFGDGLAFFFVQIAPYGYGGDTGQTAELREAQTAALALPGTGMVVTLDCGDAKDIHPTRKQAVGERLAALALARTYGLDVPCEGPVCVDARRQGDRALLTFRGAGELALASHGGGFELAGDDGVFRPGSARLVDGLVEVVAAGVSTPRAVRYAWAAVPEWSLRSSHGLPAAPFRRDIR
jgi:sialate O-acetylesterase